MADETQPRRIAWTTRAVAEMTGMHISTVAALCRSGQIPATRFGLHWLIPDSYVQTIRTGEAAA